MNSGDLKRQRVCLGWTQRELAQRLGLSPQQISNYETGRKSIPPWLHLAVQALATDKVMGLPLDKKEVSLLKEWSRLLYKTLKPDIILILLFGSKARGDDNPESDTDILILVKRRTVRMRKRIFDILFQQDPDYHFRISPIIMTLREWQKNVALQSPFMQSIKEEGIFL